MQDLVEGTESSAYFQPNGDSDILWAPEDIIGKENNTLIDSTATVVGIVVELLQLGSVTVFDRPIRSDQISHLHKWRITVGFCNLHDMNSPYESYCGNVERVSDKSQTSELRN